MNVDPFETKFRAKFPLLLSWIIFCFCGYFGEWVQASSPLSQVRIEQRLGQQLPLSLPFRDESGRVVKLGEFFTGVRPVILVMAYYHCSHVCNLILGSLKSSLEKISLHPGRDYQVVVASIDPKDTPQSARERKKDLNLAPADSWHLLVGEEKEIKTLSQAVGFNFLEMPHNGEFLHASGLMVATPEGRISRYLLGLQFEERLLQLSLMEASSLKVGPLADRLVLLCSQYDPTQGKYGLVIGRILKITGSFFALGFVGLLGWVGKSAKRDRDRDSDRDRDRDREKKIDNGKG